MKKLFLLLIICSIRIANIYAQPVADFSGNPTTICIGSSVTWSNLSTGLTSNTTYSWSFPGATENFANVQNPNPRTYTVSGTYAVSLIVSNNNGQDTIVKTNYITVLPSPIVSIIPSMGIVNENAYVGCSNPSVILTASGGASYKWSPATALNTTTGATVVASPTTNITYNVIGTNSNGCTSKESINVRYNTAPPRNLRLISGGLSTVCSGQTVGTYIALNGGQNGQNNGQNNAFFTWTVPSGAIITSGQGTRSVSITFGGVSGNICCTPSNACGSAQQFCKAITVNPTPSIGVVGSITGPATTCDNQSGVTYSIASVANAATYSWTVTGGANITAGQGTNTITVTFSTNNSNICVIASNSCNSSPEVCKSVTTTSTLPSTPGTIAGLTTVCNGQSGVNYSVASVPNAAVYTWTVPNGATITTGQGTNSVTLTFGSASGSVCVTAENGCGTSAASNCKSILVDPNPAVGTIGLIKGFFSMCSGQSNIAYSVTPVSSATTYNWTVPVGATITSGQGTNSITITSGSNSGNICVTASNNCNSTPQVCNTITVSPSIPAIPGSITGLTTVCNGQKNVIYSVANVANALAYIWTVPAGASITKGQGTNSITVTFSGNSGNICVSTENSCGVSLSNCKLITVDGSGSVGTIGKISGLASVCSNLTGVSYSIAPVTSASTYSWTVPAGATITSGQGTNTITVNFASTSGSICVYASNSCSSTSQNCLSVIVDPITPAIPGGISGATSLCAGQTGEPYWVANVANASVYSWSVPAGAVVTAGQGTNSITVTLGSSSGTVCVTAGNGCGTSLPSCQPITVAPTAVVGLIGAINGPVSACANQSLVSYSTITVANATNYTWTVPAGATITSGQGTASITVTFGSTSGDICVYASNSCSSTSLSCEAVTVASIAPTIPGTITGVTTVCSGQSGAMYSIASVANATVYTWTTPASGTVTAGQGTTAATITFGNTSGNVCVTAGNACGTSLPDCQAIKVDPNPALGAIGTIKGSKETCANLSNVTYTIAPVANAASYAWTVPTAATITAGQGTNTITVSFGNVSGNICVEASNSCGLSPQSCMVVTVSPNAPSIPSGITGPTTVCSGQVSGYSITSVPNALSYPWSAPVGSSVTSGQGTRNATVTFGSTSGNVCVAASNGCGTSLQNCKSITLNPSMLTVSTSLFNATGWANCDGSATATANGGSSYTYSWTPSGATTATASGLCIGTHTVCVKNSSGCETCKTVDISSPIAVTELTDNGTIKVFPNPANEYIIIEGAISNAATLQVNILNLFGQKIMDKSFIADGVFSDRISIANIPTGIYFIEIRSGQFIRNTKIVKIQ